MITTNNAKHPQERMDASPPVSFDQHAQNRGTCAQLLLRCLTFFLVALLGLPSVASAQIWIDEIQQIGREYTNDREITSARLTRLSSYVYTLYNRGTIVDVTVNGGTCTVHNGYNGGTGTIGTANVGTANGDGGGLYNGNGLGSTGFVVIANVNGLGRITNGYNGGTGYIETANVYGGNVTNGSTYYDDGTTGYIDTVNAYGGIVTNGYFTTGSIGTANVNGAVVYNGCNARGTGFIETANINSGQVYNGYYSGTGSIETANVDGGTLYNGIAEGSVIYLNGGSAAVLYEGNGWIGSASLEGGTVINAGRIDSMTYTGGTYTGQITGDVYVYGELVHRTLTGTIGTLSLAGDATGIDWGVVDNLAFDSNGNGVISVSAFVDDNIGYRGINAGHVDFAYGNVSLDLSLFCGTVLDLSDVTGPLWENDGFYLSTLFGATTFSGIENLSSFKIVLWEDVVEFWILKDGVFETGWSIDAVTGWVSYSSNEVPEPATLAIIGLGLAGLGLARRRHK